MANIGQNLALAFGYNATGIPLTAGLLYPFFAVVLSPTIAAAAIALSPLLVVTNANRLRRAPRHRTGPGRAPRPQAQWPRRQRCGSGRLAEWRCPMAAWIVVGVDGSEGSVKAPDARRGDGSPGGRQPVTEAGRDLSAGAS